VTAEEFERRYAERSGVTVEWLREMGRVVVPCDCGDRICEGWISVSREIAEEDYGYKPTCVVCGRPLNGYHGPKCRYCDPAADSE